MENNLSLDFTAEEADEQKRLDVFLTEVLDDFSRSAVQKLIEKGSVRINLRECVKNCKLRRNDVISVVLSEPVELCVLPQDIPLDIVYEDSDLLVVNKQKGMVVHPAAGNYENTLVNALMHHCKCSLSGINGVIRPGIVHRIDKNTSGLLIVAKNDNSHKKLAEQIKEHSFLREYEAVVYGKMKEQRGVIDLPIGRNKQDRKKMCVTQENSKNAITHYEVLHQYEDFAHIRCRLETGRTHQIRVHMAYSGHPLAGDEVYGPKKVIKSLNGQCLHAKTIGFIHPSTSQQLYFQSRLPSYFTEFLRGLR